MKRDDLHEHIREPWLTIKYPIREAIREDLTVASASLGRACRRIGADLDPRVDVVRTIRALQSALLHTGDDDGE